MIEASQLHHCSVPSDYSDVAEAYYSIAWLLGYRDTNDKRQISALEKIVFDMGRNAESVASHASDLLKLTKPCCTSEKIWRLNTMAGKETGYKLSTRWACCPENESLFSCITSKKELAAPQSVERTARKFFDWNGSVLFGLPQACSKPEKTVQ